MGSLVLKALLDFRSHVSHGPSVRLQGVDALVAGESEVGDLEVEVVVDEDVLQLEVSVDYFFIMHVFERVKQLCEEEPASVFSHLSHKLAQIKKETSLDVLHNNEDQVVNDAATRLDNNSGIAVVVHSNDSSVF